MRFLRKEPVRVFPSHISGGVIDLDVAPFVPESWRVDEEDQLPSRVRGRFEWSRDKVELFFVEQQQGRKSIQGYILKQLLAIQPVFPAHVLDWLLEHPDQIPNEYKGRYVFFWGTIYCGPGGWRPNIVRCLNWNKNEWGWSYHWLLKEWDAKGPALILKAAWV